jgi:hypothetical protein
MGINANEMDKFRFVLDSNKYKKTPGRINRPIARLSRNKSEIIVKDVLPSYLSISPQGITHNNIQLRIGNKNCLFKNSRIFSHSNQIEVLWDKTFKRFNVKFISVLADRKLLLLSCPISFSAIYNFALLQHLADYTIANSIP